MPRPELLIIPTSFCSSSLYDGQVQYLRGRGYSVHALDPPSFPANYRSDTPAPSMYDDARCIRDYVTKITDSGKDIVILAHSYGGCPTSQSLEGLTKTERVASGLVGGVVRIAYLSGVVPRLGWNVYKTVNAATAASSSAGAPAVDVDSFGWMVHKDPHATAEAVFNCLPPETRISNTVLFGPHAGPAFMDALTYPGYKYLPVSWFLCENDLSVRPEIQRDTIDMIEQSWYDTGRAGMKVDVTECQCDHMPMFSAADRLNAWMESVILADG